MLSDELSSALFQDLPGLAPAATDALTIGSDIVIHAPGFEDRTMALAESLTSSAEGRSILLDYRPFYPKNRLADVRRELEERGYPCANDDLLSYDRFEPADFRQRLRERLVLKSGGTVLVDISTMSKLAILLVLDVCRELDLDVTVYYAEAEQYGPSEQEYIKAKRSNAVHQPSLQVYTGVHGVVRVESLASVAMQGEPTAAIVFMSFNDALTQVLLNTAYPNRLFLINGRPPTKKWREEATAWIHDQVRKEWSDDNPLGPESLGIPLPARQTSTLDYRETVATLLSLYWALSTTHRIVLAPTGSKMQALGVYLAKALHPDIHIEYPSPKGFFDEYSHGVANRWLLTLGHIPNLLNSVATKERREFLEIPIT